jgi:hypothetical protein
MSILLSGVFASHAPLFLLAKVFRCLYKRMARQFLKRAATIGLTQE